MSTFVVCVSAGSETDIRSGLLLMVRYTTLDIKEGMESCSRFVLFLMFRFPSILRRFGVESCVDVFCSTENAPSICVRFGNSRSALVCRMIVFPPTLARFCMEIVSSRLLVYMLNSPPIVEREGRRSCSKFWLLYVNIAPCSVCRLGSDSDVQAEFP